MSDRQFICIPCMKKMQCRPQEGYDVWYSSVPNSEWVCCICGEGEFKDKLMRARGLEVVDE